MCAAVLKYWREAATLMLVSCRKRIMQPVMINCPPVSPDPSNMQLELMLIRRSDASSFMPNRYVFPGGVADDTDFSRKWLSVFDVKSDKCVSRRFGYLKTAEKQSPMFSRERSEEFSALPSEIAFRICAIRETFEETGVLIARSMDQANYNYNLNVAYPYNFGDSHESRVTLEDWRQKVTKDPREFLSLCKTLEVVPDVWSLYSWSNWLTPNFRSVNTKRFDTAFFICCLAEHPYAVEDATETVHLQWSSPTEILYDYKENRSQMAPPQLYETSRLFKFNTVEQLLEFVRYRADQPVERWMPIPIQCADAVIFTFPGDSLYPDRPDVEDDQPSLKTDETAEKLASQQECANLHRFVLKKGCLVDGKPVSNRSFALQCNVDLRYKHMQPQTYSV